MKRIIEPLLAGVRDTAGALAALGTVYFYEAGTTELVTVYEDWDMEEPHPNPATLDAAGILVAYTDTRIKVVVQNAAGTVIRTWDHLGTADSDLGDSSLSSAAGSGLVANGTVIDVNADGTTLTVTDDVLLVRDAGITRAKMAALSPQDSSSSGAFTSTTTGSFVDVTNLSRTFTSTGRTVRIQLIADATSNDCCLGKTVGTGECRMELKILRDATVSALFIIGSDAASGTLNTNFLLPPTMISHEEEPAAGSYTYKVQLKQATAGTMSAQYIKLRVYEVA